MLKTERVVYSGEEYVRTWSDLGMKIERDGDPYESAVDPIGSGRTYAETDVPVEAVEAEETDYLAALRSLGVDV